MVGLAGGLLWAGEACPKEATGQPNHCALHSNTQHPPNYPM
jgi:hypothetical protein